MPKKPVVITDNRLLPVLGAAVQSQQNSRFIVSLYGLVVVLRPGRPEVRIPSGALKKAHCHVLLQCAFWFDVILVSESLQQPILCHIGVLPFCRFLISKPVYSGSHRHGGERRRLSIYESLLLDCGIRQALQNLSNICIDADGLPLNFLRANRLPLVDADVGGVRVLGCHLPERIFNDNWGIIAYA